MIKLRERLKTMSFGEKVSYLWYYYKFHMLGTILAVIFLIYVVSAVVGKEEIALNVVITGEAANTGQLEQLDQRLDEELIDEQSVGSAEVALQFLNVSGEETNQAAMVGAQKFAAQLATGSIDVLIADKRIFEMLEEQGEFSSLGEVIDLEKIDKEQHEFVYSESNQVVGISTANMEKLQEIIAVEDKILLVPPNPENTSYIDEFVTFLTTP